MAGFSGLWRVLGMRAFFYRTAAGCLAIFAFAGLIYSFYMEDPQWFILMPGVLMAAYAILGDKLGGRWTKQP